VDRRIPIPIGTLSTHKIFAFTTVSMSILEPYATVRIL